MPQNHLQIPGPKGLPLIGLRGNIARFAKDPVANLVALHREYGEIVALARGTGGPVCTFGPEYNKMLFSDADQFHVFDQAIIPGPPGSPLKRLNTAVVLMNGTKHAQQRRLISPSLHRQALPAYRRDMIDLTLAALSHWKVGQPIDISLAMQHLTLAIATKVLLGLDPAAEQTAELGRMIKRWMTLSGNLPTMLPWNFPGTQFHRMSRLAEQLEVKIVDTLRRKREAAESDQDVLSVLVRTRDEDGTRMSDTELLGNTLALYIIGHQTMTDVLMWTFFLLSQHPQVLDEVDAELQTVLAGEEPTFEKLGSLPVLDNVLKETLRLLPPQIYQYRIAQQPFQLAGYQMPKGAMLVFSAYVTHRMPNLFPEPQRFLPERWKTIKPSPYEYLPFGAGAHGCLGPNFAYMEMKIIIALVLQRFRLNLAEGGRVDRANDPTLATQQGIPMVVMPPRAPFTPGRATGDVHQMVDLPGGEPRA